MTRASIERPSFQTRNWAASSAASVRLFPGWSPAISKSMSGRPRSLTSDGIPEVTFFGSLKYAKLGHNPDWFKEHMEFEANASDLKICEPTVVPGLLQTEDYARAVFTAGGSNDVEVDVAPEWRFRRC